MLYSRLAIHQVRPPVAASGGEWRQAAVRGSKGQQAAARASDATAGGLATVGLLYLSPIPNKIKKQGLYSLPGMLGKLTP